MLDYKAQKNKLILQNNQIAKEIKDKNMQAKQRIQKEIMKKEQARRLKEERIHQILNDLDKINSKEIQREIESSKRRSKNQTVRKEKLEKFQSDKLKIVKINFDIKNTKPPVAERKK